MGDEYIYVINTVAAATAGESVQGTGTVTSPSEHVTNIDISSIPSGEIVFTVSLKNPEGNLGPAAQIHVTLDTVLPSGYKIAADQAVLNPSLATQAGFIFTGATVGDAYNFTVTSNGTGGSVSSVTGSGPIGSAGQNVTPINVSGLAEGTLTYRVTLTSPDGNVGAAVTATATYEAQGPSGFTVTPDEATINSVAANSTGFTLGAARTSKRRTSTRLRATRFPAVARRPSPAAAA